MKLIMTGQLNGQIFEISIEVAQNNFLYMSNLLMFEAQLKTFMMQNKYKFNIVWQKHDGTQETLKNEHNLKDLGVQEGDVFILQGQVSQKSPLAHRYDILKKGPEATVKKVEKKKKERQTKIQESRHKARELIWAAHRKIEDDIEDCGKQLSKMDVDDSKSRRSSL